MSTAGIGNRIKEIRNELGLSQQKFGERLKITKSHVSKVELSQDQPSDMLTKLICMEFNINEEWLLTGEGPKKRELGIYKFLENIQDKEIEKLLIVLSQLNLTKRTEAIKCLGDFTELINYVYSDKGYEPFYAKPRTIVRSLAHIYGMVAGFKLLSDTFNQTLFPEPKTVIKFHVNELIKNLTKMVDREIEGIYVDDEEEIGKDDE